MKIKVDKKEYEQLLERVKKLEQYKDKDWDRFHLLEEQFRDYIENYFTERCKVVMIKRDKNELIAELRRNVMNNIFKIQEEE